MIFEEVFLNHLNEHLTVECYTEKPANEPEYYVILQKTGSSHQVGLESSIFAIQSYAPTHYDAAVLNEEVMDVVEMLIENDLVTKVARNSSYPFPDTQTKRYRYQVVYEIYHY